MAYLVTHGRGGGPAAIDIGHPKQFDLNNALLQACRLLSQRLPNVAIQDGNGRSISGDDLVACCKGEKTLTPDLRAV